MKSSKKISFSEDTKGVRVKKEADQQVVGATICDLSAEEKLKVSRLVSKLVELGHENERLLVQLENMRLIGKKENESLYYESITKISDLESQMLNFKKKSEALSEKYASSLQLLIKYQNKISEFHCALSQSGELLSNKINECEEYKSRIDEFHTQSLIQEKSISNLRNQVRDLEREKVEWTLKYESLNESYCSLEQRTLRADELNESLSNLIKQLHLNKFANNILKTSASASLVSERQYGYPSNDPNNVDGISEGSATISPDRILQSSQHYIRKGNQKYAQNSDVPCQLTYLPESSDLRTASNPYLFPHIEVGHQHDAGAETTMESKIPFATGRDHSASSSRKPSHHTSPMTFPSRNRGESDVIGERYDSKSNQIFINKDNGEAEELQPADKIPDSITRDTDIHMDIVTERSISEYGVCKSGGQNASLVTVPKKSEWSRESFVSVTPHADRDMDGVKNNLTDTAHYVIRKGKCVEHDDVEDKREEGEGESDGNATTPQPSYAHPDGDLWISAGADCPTVDQVASQSRMYQGRTPVRVQGEDFDSVATERDLVHFPSQTPRSQYTAGHEPCSAEHPPSSRKRNSVSWYQPPVVHHPHAAPASAPRAPVPMSRRAQRSRRVVSQEDCNDPYVTTTPASTIARGTFSPWSGATVDAKSCRASSSSTLRRVDRADVAESYGARTRRSVRDYGVPRDLSKRDFLLESNHRQSPGPRVAVKSKSASHILDSYAGGAIEGKGKDFEDGSVGIRRNTRNVNKELAESRTHKKYSDVRGRDVDPLYVLDLIDKLDSY